MPRIIVMGVSGSGKSTVGVELAALFDLPFLEGDSLHSAENVAKMEAGIPLEDTDRWPWLSNIGEELAGSEEGIIISCSSLKKSYREFLREKASSPLLFVFLDGSCEVLQEHMQNRTGHFMPVSMLESQMATLESPVGEPYVFQADVANPVSKIVHDSAVWVRSFTANNPID